MSDALDFKRFSRKPFEVEAVQVTTENIEHVAKFIGELKQKEDGTPYILVNRRLIPNIHRVYPGFWMTRMGDNVRCYSARIFEEQFELSKTATNVTITYPEGTQTLS